MNERRTIDLVLTASGRSTGKMRNEITVRMPRGSDSFEEYEMATDEGDFHGGDGTAPPPLAFFATAMVGCLMTQVRAFSKRLGIPIRSVNIDARLHWQATMVSDKLYEGAPCGFSVDIDIDSDAAEDDIRRLVQVAKKACFIDQTLAVANRVTHRLKTRQGWSDA